MNNLSKALLGLAMVAVTLPAFADDVNTRPYYLDLDYSHVFSESSRDSKDGNGYNVGLGKEINKYWNVEIDGFYNYMKAGSGTPSNYWHEYGGKLDGMFFYSRNRSFSPYFGVGIGGVETEFDKIQKSFDPFVDAGLGMFSFIDMSNGHSIGLRADIRYRWTLDAENIPGYTSFHEPVLRVGLVIPFGLPKHEHKAPMCCAAVAQAPAAPAFVPAPAPAAAPVVAPAPAPVDEPIRSFEDVHFNYNKSDLTAPSRGILDNAATTINGLAQKYPSLKVDVSGHTDSKGTQGYNQALSERLWLDQAGCDQRHDCGSRAEPPC
jgi:OOP family OmpA-OmpF porin